MVRASRHGDLEEDGFTPIAQRTCFRPCWLQRKSSSKHGSGPVGINEKSGRNQRVLDRPRTIRSKPGFRADLKARHHSLDPRRNDRLARMEPPPCREDGRRRQAFRRRHPGSHEGWRPICRTARPKRVGHEPRFVKRGWRPSWGRPRSASAALSGSLDYFVLLDGTPLSLWRSHEEPVP
jgi:hypothetical protein